MIPAARRAVSTILAAAVLTVLGAVPALAHVDLVASDPADQQTLSESPPAIKLVFSTEMEPAGPGIRLEKADGTPQPVEVTQASATELDVTLTQHLENGGYLVSWTVAAGDSHPRSGSIGFAVAGQDPNGVTTGSSAASGTAAPDQGNLSAISPPQSKETRPLASAKLVGWVARWLTMIGALLGIGVLAFAATCLTGSVYEVRGAAYWVRRAGIVVLLGSLLQASAAAALIHGSWSPSLTPSGFWSVVDGSFGWAVLMRVGGGAALLFGAQLSTLPVRANHLVRPNGGAHSYGGRAHSYEEGRVALRDQQSPTSFRLNVSRSKMALAGAALVAISYLFDGHTVTSEPVWLVKIADLVHVIGGGVWVGGVAMMSWVLRRRQRLQVSLRAGELAVRFSTIAAGALVLLTLAGVALTAAILDLPNELFTTDFGRWLLFKVVVVGAAAAIGGYNHRVVIPELVDNPTEPHASDRLRSTVRMEARILLAVIAITAALVSAAS